MGPGTISRVFSTEAGPTFFTEHAAFFKRRLRGKEEQRTRGSQCSWAPQLRLSLPAYLSLSRFRSLARFQRDAPSRLLLLVSFDDLSSPWPATGRLDPARYIATHPPQRLQRKCPTKQSGRRWCVACGPRKQHCRPRRWSPPSCPRTRSQNIPLVTQRRRAFVGDDVNAHRAKQGKKRAGSSADCRCAPRRGECFLLGPGHPCSRGAKRIPMINIYGLVFW